MVNLYPLLDGREIDLDQLYSADPTWEIGEHNRAAVLRASPDFFGGALPPWLSYVTDNGPGSVTFNSDGSVTLSTGTTSSGDQSYLETSFGLNWDDWRVIHFGVSNFSVADAQEDANGHITYGDGLDIDDVAEGIGFVTYADADLKVVTGGTVQKRINNDLVTPENGNPYSFAISLREHELGTGHTAFFSFDGKPMDAWAQGQGFPSATSLKFRVGVDTLDTAATRSCSFDDIYLAMVK